MIYSQSRSLCTWPFILLMAVSVSCNRKDATGDAVHSEHEHFPAHWPNTIFVASKRLVALKGDRGQSTQFEGIPLERELVDLIRWLPELTADSDLKEADFDRVDSWSIKYAPLLESKLKEGVEIKSMLAIDGIGDAIDELQRIVLVESERLAALEGP